MHDGNQFIVVAKGGREHPPEFITLGLPWLGRGAITGATPKTCYRLRSGANLQGNEQSGRSTSEEVPRSPTKP